MKYSRSLVATLLMSGSLLNSVAPVFAQTVPLPAADSSISNTANATYEDPNVPNTPISTVSNTVVVKVAKVAGILVEKVDFTQPVGVAGFQPNQTVYSNFDVTNTGNDGVKFKVPNLADVSSNVTFNKVEYFNGTNWVPVTDANGSDSQTIAVGAKLKVRIVLTINGNAAANQDIVATLGNTSTPGLVNAERGVGTESINGKDIYTVDVTTAGAGVILGGTATNGVREASATQTIKVNAVKQAFAVIDVTNETPQPIVLQNGTITPKDTVKYNISVTVPTSDPTNSGKQPTDLAPTSISLATNDTAATPTTVNRVIISDPIPAGSTLTSLPTTPATGLPAGWTPVYEIAGTPNVWTTVAPGNLTTITKVGFIYEPTAPTTAGSTPAATGTSLPTSTTPYSGFSITLTTTNVGAQAPNVVSIDGTTPTALGAPDPTKPVNATDTITVTTTRAATISAIYNGPVDKPLATGPGNDNNKDFSNKSMQLLAADAFRYTATDTIPVGYAVGDLKPTVSSNLVTFSNTINNSTNVAGDVYVVPTAPAVMTDLPDNTEITVKNINGSDTRTYTYSSITGVGVFTATNVGTNTTPLKLAIGANNNVSYAVDVKLPAGLKQLTGYPVPLTAFAAPTVVPSSTTNIPTDAVKNITIDKVYTGYINLIKEARLLDVITAKDDTTIPYVSGTAATALKAVPGKFIQYRIKAVNVSEDASGGSVDSKLLSATNVKMQEDGLALPNSWGNTTSHAITSAETYVGNALQNASTVTFSDKGVTKNNTDTDVSRYDVNLGTAVILPQQEASFIFVRQVNKTP
jgi:hypothetical protein